MKRNQLAQMGKLLAAALVGLISTSLQANAKPGRSKQLAYAEIMSCTGEGKLGTAFLAEQRSKEGIKTVKISLKVKGLTSGAHAVHIHETGTCDPCSAAGGHFDPGPNSNSKPDGNHPFHMGDLVNIKVGPSGRGHLKTQSTRITLSPGPLSIFDTDGSAFIIHDNKDTFCPEGSTPGCAGGSRAACGIIRPQKPGAKDTMRRQNKRKKTRAQKKRRKQQRWSETEET
ncbi:MAG: superoxide dismutase family protein [Myxococcales bacterium]|nr:superoxide dismutase family protein [Myxococcales bacterium]